MTIPQTTVIFDLDGTLTRRDTYLGFLFGYLKLHPMRLARTAHLPVAVLMHKIGLRDNSWLKENFLNAVMGGVEKSAVTTWSENFTDRLVHDGLRPDAVACLREHQQSGCRLILATASLDFYVVRLGEKLGFDVVICTQAAWNAQERLTGLLAGRNCYGPEKLRRVKSWLKEHGESDINIVYSDHHSDASLLEWAREAIVVNPTKQLRQLALRKNMKIANW